MTTVQWTSETPAVPGAARVPIRAVVFTCPVLKRQVTEVWAGLEPVVAANTYLRSNSAWAVSTVDTKARHLVLFFQWLADRGLSFWSPEVRTGGHLIAEFRNSLTERCRPEVPEEDRQTSRYAKSVMYDVFLLCKHWRQPGDPPLGGEPAEERTKVVDGRGAQPQRTHQEEQLPGAFKVSIPSDERNRKKPALLPEEVERIWVYLGAARQPKPPELVRRHPGRPRPEWSPTERSKWARATGVYARRLARHRRRQMLWALMLASGMRRREIPLITNRDVRLYRGQLWVGLHVRRQHAHLGRAKTGSRMMYIGFDRRVMDAWLNWQESRAVLVAQWTARTGLPDHGMFLVNDRGGPLTVGGILAFCEHLNAAFSRPGVENDTPFGDEGLGEGGFRLHPHAVRHTITSLFRLWKVDKDVIRRHLGHRREQTTADYGKAYRAECVAILDANASRALAAAADR